jgi:adenine deaminase
MFYLPYVEKAWNELGWKLCVMVTDDIQAEDLIVNSDSTVIIELPNVEGLRSETIVQAGRLYAANHLPEDSFIMTSDMDLIPLSDYWHPKEDEVTVYGYDLTDRTEYPISYIAMTRNNWIKYLSLTGDTERDMLKDASTSSNAYSEVWERWWGYDQQLITKLIPKQDITFIDRGRINIAGANLAIGRVDRYNWKETQNQATFIDAHCENLNVQHPVKLEPFLELYNKFYTL